MEAVYDGRAGIALFHEKIFDLALVDIKLPDMQGPELVSRLSPLHPETEYIMVTAHATMETAEEAIRERQIIGYENKPVDIDRLLTFIGEVVRRRRAEESLQKSEEKYRNILESIGEGYYEVDLAGNFTFFNDAMCRIRGYSGDELMWRLSPH